MTRAVKLKRRPPLTTLATRLIATTRSMYDVPLSAPPRPAFRPSRRSPPWPPPLRGAAISGSSSRIQIAILASGASELEPLLARAVRQSGDAAVVLVAGAVEHDRADARLHSTLREELAHLARLGGLVAGVGTEVGLHRRRGGERVARGVVDDVGEHVRGRAGHDQPRPCDRAQDLLADP